MNDGAHLTIVDLIDGIEERCEEHDMPAWTSKEVINILKHIKRELRR